MAKRKGFEMIEEPTKKSKIRYFAKYLNFTFDVGLVDEDGKPVYKQNNQGILIIDGDGNKIQLQRQYKFIQLEQRAAKGYLSYFDYDPDDSTPQNIKLGERLVKLDKEEGTMVMRSDHYESIINPKAFSEKKRADELQAENVALKEMLKSPEALQAKLEELTRP